MSYKVTYTCDICRDDTPIERLMGCNFSTLKKFRLDSPDSTKGVHICMGCLGQLQEQLATKRLPIPDENEVRP